MVNHLNTCQSDVYCRHQKLENLKPDLGLKIGKIK
jgi:hypothetical protein